MPCCATNPNRAGQWYYPNGTQIPTLGAATTFYRNRGDGGTVNLNRLNSDVMSPTGLFCCVVPDATGVDQTVCVDIGTCIIASHHACRAKHRVAVGSLQYLCAILWKLLA